MQFNAGSSSTTATAATSSSRVTVTVFITMWLELWPFDLLVPCLVLIPQAVFLLEHALTHRKNWVVGCWRGCLGWGADMHIAQQMPQPLTISCSSKSRLVLTFLVLPFWYLLTRVVPDIFQKSSKTVVCVWHTDRHTQTYRCHASDMPAWDN